MKPGISAVVVAYNQTELLKKCLTSIISLADEIIVIDLESTEDVQAVAKQYQASYVKHTKVALVEEVRQMSLHYVHHDYVLFIDPDETIPQTLASDLSAKIKEGKYDYFMIPRQNYVFGKWIRHSRWWPDMIARVFRQGKVSWGKTLHAEAVRSGNGYSYPAEVQYAIHHENYKTLDEYMSKNVRYAKADAQERLAAKHPLLLSETLHLSVNEVISRFFLDQGYKDGMHGLILAILQSFYYFLVYGYYWEGKKYAELETQETIKSFPHTWFRHGLSEILYWEPKKDVIKSLHTKLVRKMLI